MRYTADTVLLAHKCQEKRKSRRIKSSYDLQFRDSDGELPPVSTRSACCDLKKHADGFRPLAQLVRGSVNFRQFPYLKGPYAIYGYEAAKVVLEAVKSVGKKDRDAIRKAVLATKDFDKGALGKWSFDADGDTTLQVITVSKIEDGKFKPVKVLEGDGK